jgi:hypothetical protein
MSERYEHIYPEGAAIVGPGEVLGVERIRDLAVVLGDPNASALVVEGSREALQSWARGLVEQLAVATRDVRHLRADDEIWLADEYGDRMQVTVTQVVPHPEAAWSIVHGRTPDGDVVQRPVPSAGSVPVVHEP